MNHTKPGLAAVDATLPPLPLVPARGLLRRQTAPYKVAAVLWSAAWLAQAAVWLFDDRPGVTWTVAGLAGVAAVFVALVAGRDRSRRVRLWLCACLTAAVTWLTVATGAGVTWNTTSVLAVAAWSLALPWWRVHRIATPAEGVHVEQTAPVAVVDAVLSVPALWAQNVASKNGPLPDSYLTDPQINKIKACYTVQLKAGRQSISTAMAELVRVASGLGVGPEDIVMERVPGDASRVRLTVVIQSPIRDRQDFPGPQWTYDPTTGYGYVSMGPYADGDGQAPWKVFSKNSMHGGFIVGASGTGKSRLIEGLATSMRASGLITVFYGDPQGGTSSDALITHATWPGRGIEEIMELLRGLGRAVHWRGLENSYLGRTGFTPSTNRPGLMGIIDECNMVFGDPVHGKEATAIAERIVRIGRKVGVNLILADQEGDLASFGNSNALRNNVRANTVVLRTQNKQTAGVLGLDFDPKMLPAIPGYAYTVAPPQSNVRTAPFRAWYLDELTEDETEDVHTGAAPRKGTSHYWLARYPDADVTPDEVLVKALGQPFADRHASVEEARADLRSQLDMLLSGAIDPTAAAAAAPAVDPEYGPIVAFPAAVDVRRNAPAPVRIGGLTPSQHDVYQGIAAGTVRPGDLIKLTGLSETAVRNALEELQQTGRVIKVRHGIYALGSGEPTGPGTDLQALRAQGMHLVVSTGLASSPMLQRRLGLTAEHADDLLEHMQALNMISAPGVDGARQVLANEEQLLEAADVAGGSNV